MHKMEMSAFPLLFSDPVPSFALFPLIGKDWIHWYSDCVTEQTHLEVQKDV